MKLIMENWKKFLKEGSSPEEAVVVAKQIQTSPQGQKALKAAAQDPQVQAALERAAAELQQGSLEEELINPMVDPESVESTAASAAAVGGIAGGYGAQWLGLAAWPQLMAAVEGLPAIVGLVGAGAGAAAGLGIALLAMHMQNTNKKRMTEEEMSRRSALKRLGGGAAGAAVVASGTGAALASNDGFQNAVIRPFLQDAEQALASYLKDNAPDFAERLVPDIPFDADIIESLMKRTIATAIRANAEEIAECTMNFVTPDFVASLESLDDEELQRYAEE
jgi:hypothetical protein